MRSPRLPVAVVAAAGVAVVIAAPGRSVAANTQPDNPLGRHLGMSVQPSGCIAQLDYDLKTRERVGQVIWVGLRTTSAPGGADSVVTDNRPGGVVEPGGFSGGISATAATTTHVHPLGDPRVRITASVDQAGGYVKHLQGTGVSDIPTGDYQGRTYGSSGALLALTERWGAQPQAAGIDVNLATVADTVAKDFMPYNGPLGRYQRNYDYVTSRVRADVDVVISGMHAGRVATTVKHCGDIVLTADPATVGPITGRSCGPGRQSSPGKAQLDAAVLRVLTVKTARGLTRCS